MRTGSATAAPETPNGAKGLAVRRAFPTLLIITLLATLPAGLASGGSASVDRYLTTAGEASMISILPIASVNNDKPLTTQNLDLIRQIPGVSQVVPNYITSVAAPPAAEPSDLSLAVQTWGSTPRPPITAGTAAEQLAPDEIVVPEQTADVNFRRYVGKTITISYPLQVGPETTERAVRQLTVAATYDPRWMVAGPEAGFVAPSTATELFAAEKGLPPADVGFSQSAQTAAVFVRDPTLIEPVTDRVDELRFGAVPVDVRKSGTTTSLAVWGHALTGILFIAAVLFGFRASRQRSSRGAEDRPNDRLKLLGAGGLLVGVAGTGLGILLALLLRVPFQKFLGLPIATTSVVPHAGLIVLTAMLPALGLTIGALLARRSAREPVVSN